MPIFQTTPVSPTSSSGSTGTGNSILGKDDFLKLLTQQLQYQDPLNPMQGSDFAAQLAQFSSVEQLNNISDELTSSINANLVLTQSINNGLAAGYVGKEVRVSNNTVQLGPPGDNLRNVKLGYTLPSAASNVTVTIKDSNGNVVRTMQVNATNKGDNTFSWDGTNNSGADVPAGNYTFSVDAKDSNNNSLSTSLFTYGTVTSVLFAADGTKFVVDGQQILLSNILEVMGG